MDCTDGAIPHNLIKQTPEMLPLFRGAVTVIALGGGPSLEELWEGAGLMLEPLGSGWGYVGDVVEGGGVELV